MHYIVTCIFNNIAWAHFHMHMNISFLLKALHFFLVWIHHNYLIQSEWKLNFR